MRRIILNLALALIVACIFINCANRGNPNGGEKDTDPPKILNAYPKNYTTNFKGNEIKIVFNEYIKIKDLQKQLIISPPMQTQPEIMPQGGASKFISIKIFDTLQPNTTYAFNFGNSIEDNNEGNPFSFYRYVFSTGTYIDSLKVSGTITDAYKRNPATFVSVMLYEVDSTFTDSIIYKTPPKYITNTLDSLTTFTLENVKEGNYLLVALKDKNGDNKFQQKSDQIGFRKEFIKVPTDTTYTIKLFKEPVDFKPSRPLLINGEKIMIGYEGDYTDAKFSVNSELPEDFEFRITKDDKKDTLYYWYKPKLELDSIVLDIAHPNPNSNKSFTVRLKDKERDSLVISSAPNGTINYDQDFNISSNIPFTNFDASKVKLIDKDSLAVPYTLKPLDSVANTYTFAFDKTEDNSYRMELLPGALTDFFENTNDTITYTLNTPKKDSFGNLRLNVNNATYPIIVQLTTEKGDVKYEKYATTKAPLDFLNITPGNYFIRVIFDTNGNKIYDTGNYLNKTQPELVKHSETQIEEVRAGWDLETSFTLKD
jgi:uncharacterized protein (DUF2141 family)